MFNRQRAKDYGNNIKSPKSSSNTTIADKSSSRGDTMVIASPPSSAIVAATTSTTPLGPYPAANLESTDGRFGIQTISNPPNADMDIWFVHGLTGDRESTWTHPSGTFTPDLLHVRLPTARIITYGYDANVTGIWQNASGEGLRGHGKALAYAISNTRPNKIKRPIFFIAHSLGGLVTEQALLVSLEPNEPRLRSIAPCTAGIIFMGTPHAGSYLATWGFTLARLLDRVWRTNKTILSVLKKQSVVLKGVEEIFQRHLTPQGALKHVKIFCFYETVPVDVVGFVVPEESATILPHPKRGIDANHMDMTKFTSLNDAGFISVQGVLDDWIKQGVEQLAKEVETRSKDATSAATTTFNNRTIKAKLVQQGNHNAGRDIIHGDQTNKSARDWTNRDQKVGGKSQRRPTTDEDESSSDDSD